MPCRFLLGVEKHGSILALGCHITIYGFSCLALVFLNLPDLRGEIAFRLFRQVFLHLIIDLI